MSATTPAGVAVANPERTIMDSLPTVMIVRWRDARSSPGNCHEPPLPGDWTRPRVLRLIRAEAEKALALDPNNADAWVALGNAAASTDPPQSAKARDDYKKAITLDPSKAGRISITATCCRSSPDSHNTAKPRCSIPQTKSPGTTWRSTPRTSATGR